MSRKPNDGYNLPGASRAGIPQLLQLKKHEGFTPEYIAYRDHPRVMVGDGPAELFKADPPEWTEQAHCLDDWERFDEPRADMFHTEVKPICEGCPVKDICLSSALEEEEDVPLNLRTGVRGGLRPKERVRLAAGGPPDRECSEGHNLAELGGYFNITKGNGYWSCAECQRSKKRARLAARREQEAAA